MRTRSTTLLAAPVVFLLLTGGLVHAADSTMLFAAKPGPTMKVRIEGTSTVHDWQVEGHLLAGSLEVGQNFPVEPGQAVTSGPVTASATIRIPVNSLKSIEKDGSPYSDKMNEVMYDKMKAAANAWILFSLKELTLKEAAKAKDAPYVYDVKGDLAVAGITNKVTTTVNVLPLGDKKLKISGNFSLKMTDFGVQPPVLVGILSTGDAVKISFDWPLEQRTRAAAAK